MGSKNVGTTADASGRCAAYPTYPAPNFSHRKACPSDDCEYPDVKVGDVVVFRKGKSFYRLNTVDTVTEKSIVFGSGSGSSKIPKSTYRSWNAVLLRIANDDDLKRFDERWRGIDGNLQNEDEQPTPADAAPLQNLSETFYVIRRKSDDAFLFQFGCNDVFEPAKSIADATHFSGLFANSRDFEVRVKEIGKRGKGALLSRSKWKWVKVRATYELTVEAAPTVTPDEPKAKQPEPISRMPVEQKERLQRDWASGEYTKKELGIKHGVSYATVLRILREELGWKPSTQEGAAA